MDNIRQRYERRKNSYSNLLNKQKKAEREISLIRLLVFLIEVNLGVYAYLTHNKIFFAFNILIFLLIFSFLVIFHRRLKDRIKYTALLIEINIKCLKRIDGEWDSFKDDGKDFMDYSHKYLSDLDIFGHRSLFQWINTANTFEGRNILRGLLSDIKGDLNEIRERQEAINELVSLHNWRQKFIAEGMIISGNARDPKDLIDWTNQTKEHYRAPWVKGLVRILPCVTIILLTLRFINSISWHLPIVFLIVQFLIIIYKGQERHQLFNLAEKYNKDLLAYYNMLRLIEGHSFKSSYITGIQEGLKDYQGHNAHKQIDFFTSIVNSISNRRNSFYLIFNILTLWDLQTLIALEKWKQRYGHYLKNWIEAIGTVEALASLSVIRSDNPDWAIPTITDNQDTVLEASNIGHPLLLKNRVSNNISLNNQSKVLLITGSNMSGKSTLLRTAGINLVLAYAGAPVCARNFNASMMDIYTCMRVTDNQSENISSFYAELLRIKNIVKAAESGKRTFFLLDEIFKGTNSIDRHTGAMVLIDKLSKTNSIGLVSTHDLELCDLENTNKKIVNYHFQEHYKDNKIYFDYKLRKGASTTRNALYLMKLAGIDLQYPHSI